MSGKLLAAIAAVVLGGLGIVGIFACGQSVEGTLRQKCRGAGTQRDPNGNRAKAYDCRQRPSVLAASLAKAHAPADRRSTPNGHFLRYGSSMVGIVPQGSGSRAYVANERAGYGFFFPFVGGWWGSSRGRAETFRGGGPGVGK